MKILITVLAVFTANLAYAFSGASTSCGYSSRSSELLAYVIDVYDGDTMTVLDALGKRYTIRLLDIDAPEMSMKFGSLSRQQLHKIVHGECVLIKIAGKDNYDRTLGTVYWNSSNVNLFLVRSGLAWVYMGNGGKNIDLMYFRAEHKARQEYLGIWSSQPYPEPPWEYRRKQREKNPLIPKN